MVTLNHPAAGNTSWFTPVDQNWTTIEQSLDQAICQGRLTLSSTLPVPTSDITGATTLYFLPYKGDRIYLYNGSTWVAFSIPPSSGSPTSLSLAGLLANVTYDVFVYNNSGTLTLSTTAWKSVTATNNPAAGSSVVINVADTSGVAVGNLVTVAGGGNAEVATVTAVVANTSITVATLAHSYTTPTVYYPTRSTALAIQNGVPVSGSDSTKRFLGMIRITATAGQCEDSQVKRLVCNYYNRILRRLFTCPAYADDNAVTSYACSNTVWDQISKGTGTGGSDSRVAYLSNGEDVGSFKITFKFDNTLSRSAQGGIGVDTPNTSKIQCIANVPASDDICASGSYEEVSSEGFHTADLLGMQLGSNSATVIADDVRNGGSHDPYCTYLTATVFG